MPYAWLYQNTCMQLLSMIVPLRTSSYPRSLVFTTSNGSWVGALTSVVTRRVWPSMLSKQTQVFESARGPRVCCSLPI
jgi:hypothetical protein